MADEKNKPAAISAEEFEALKARLDLAEAKLAAQEEAILEQPNYGDEAVTSKKPAKAQLSGEPFKVDGAQYKVKYPVISHQGKKITEADILASEDLQKDLVANYPGVLQKLAAFLLFLFAFNFAQASTVTITPNGAEVVATGYTTREFYQLQDLMFIHRASNDAFEIQVTESRSKVWGGNIDSVLVTGISNDSAGAVSKLAYFRTMLLEATTTNGYRVFIGRNNLEFYFKTSTNRLDVKYSRNKQPLWFGHIDSLKCNGSAATLAYLRSINRYKAQDYLPSTSVATIAAGAAAGSSPTVAVTGDAYSGSISITTGTSATTGTLATVTLKITATTGTRISLTPTNAGATLHFLRVAAAGTTTTLVISVPATALSDATAYTYNYTVVPY